jgi:hypothetical protein
MIKIQDKSKYINMQQSNNGRYVDYRRDLRIEMIKHSVLKQQMDTTGHNRWTKQGSVAQLVCHGLQPSLVRFKIV